MMNLIWGFMLIIGIVFSVVNGRISQFTDGLMNSCG